MMGMMTLVRVLPDQEYDQMMQRIRHARLEEGEERKHES
jgi:hypothetical protein